MHIHTVSKMANVYSQEIAPLRLLWERWVEYTPNPLVKGLLVMLPISEPGIVC